jgi:hypothetical protein
MLGVWLSWPSLGLVIDFFYQCIQAQSFCVSSENKGWQDPMPVVTHVSVAVKRAMRHSDLKRRLTS